MSASAANSSLITLGHFGSRFHSWQKRPRHARTARRRCRKMRWSARIVAKTLIPLLGWHSAESGSGFSAFDAGAEAPRHQQFVIGPSLINVRSCRDPKNDQFAVVPSAVPGGGASLPRELIVLRAPPDVRSCRNQVGSLASGAAEGRLRSALIGRL
jgi:hypothetical protein